MWEMVCKRLAPISFCIAFLCGCLHNPDDRPCNVFKKNKHQKTLSKPIDQSTPEEIKKHLDGYVIGQEEVKKVLAVATYNHYKRIKNTAKTAGTTLIKKANVLLVGGTGTGKTLLACALAELLDVPCCIVDATSLTQVGFVGRDVDQIIADLLAAANYDIAAAERGIVYIDEIDKIACKQQNGFPGITHDITGQGVQRSLLKLLEGSMVPVTLPQNRRKAERSHQRTVYVNTEKILFICGGAFEDMTQQDITVKDLKEYGLMAELVGRLPIIKRLEPLDSDRLRSILTEPNDALIKGYVDDFAQEGLKLSFSDEAISLIANQAIELKLGARGLHNICEKIMADVMFYGFSSKNKKEWVIDEDYVKKQLNLQ